jgi:hypothetical protein
VRGDAVFFAVAWDGFAAGGAGGVVGSDDIAGDVGGVFQGTWVVQGGASIVFVSPLPALSIWRDPVAESRTPEPFVSNDPIADARALELSMSPAADPPPAHLRVSVDALLMFPLRAALSHALGRKRPVRMLPVPEALAPAVGRLSEWLGHWTGEQPILNRDKAREMVAEAWTCAPDRAMRELGFHARWAPIQAGLEDAVGWYRAEGLLPSA